MEFNFERTYEILERTPRVLKELLASLPEDWTHHNEGEETWSPYDILGHLIHGENTDWMARLYKIIRDEDKTFIPFDRFAQFEESKGKSLQQLLDEFEHVRKKNLDELRSLNLSKDDLKKTGIHPKFGEVTLSQLLSTWTIHDLTHIAQVTRVMANQYKQAIGPWIEFFRVLQ